MTSLAISTPVRGWLAAIALIALAACGGGKHNNTASASAPTVATSQELADTFAATLTGAQTVPANQSAAQGAGTLMINPATRTLVATVATTGIAATAVDIQEGSSGTNGAIVLPLTEAAPGSGAWGASATLTQAQFASLQAGNFYFSVSSAAFPGGELRGQLTPSRSTGALTANAGFDDFASALRGSQETPATPSTAQGAGTAIVDLNTRAMIAAVTTIGVTGTAVNIRSGAPGANGPALFPLTQGTQESGIWFARATLNAEQLVLLQAGNFYFNVQSTAFPNGEIRGQLVPRQIGGSSAGTGTGTTGATNTTNIGTGTGTPFGTPGGSAGIGSTGFGAGIGTTGIGTPTFGTSSGGTGTGVAGIGTTGISSSGSGTGTSGFGAGIGTTGISTSTPTFGTSTGSTGTGAAGTGTTGTSGAGFGTGTTGFSTGIGTPTLGTSSGGTGTGVAGIGTTGIGTSGISSSGFGTGTTGSSAGTIGIGTGTTGSVF